MLDRRFIVENAELVEQNCQRRGAKADVDRFVALEAERASQAGRGRRAQPPGQ